MTILDSAVGHSNVMSQDDDVFMAILPNDSTIEESMTNPNNNKSHSPMDSLWYVDM